jgi:hypothetical protein
VTRHHRRCRAPGWGPQVSLQVDRPVREILDGSRRQVEGGRQVVGRDERPPFPAECHRGGREVSVHPRQRRDHPGRDVIDVDNAAVLVVTVQVRTADPEFTGETRVTGGEGPRCLPEPAPLGPLAHGPLQRIIGMHPWAAD